MQCGHIGTTRQGAAAPSYPLSDPPPDEHAHLRRSPSSFHFACALSPITRDVVAPRARCSVRASDGMRSVIGDRLIGPPPGVLQDDHGTQSDESGESSLSQPEQARPQPGHLLRGAASARVGRRSAATRVCACVEVTRPRLFA